ncbi:LytR/AlgR family response regulator transcription factor [Tenacibaculum maritimum]|uniref:LytR/AlgR family response regulator transcription factor n=1 Tax=Tenacibaculum maritimum TaxID=107401 RepID=UPI00132F6488
MIATKTLKDIQKKFNFPEFFRVHNSYVINLDFVIEYNKGVNELTMKDGARVSVSRSKKSELMEKLYLDK